MRPFSAGRSNRCLRSAGSAAFQREIEKFIIRQPPKGEKDDNDSENSWISDGLPSFSNERVWKYRVHFLEKKIREQRDQDFR